MRFWHIKSGLFTSNVLWAQLSAGFCPRKSSLLLTGCSPPPVLIDPGHRAPHWSCSLLSAVPRSSLTLGTVLLTGYIPFSGSVTRVRRSQQARRCFSSCSPHKSALLAPLPRSSLTLGTVLLTGYIPFSGSVTRARRSRRARRCFFSWSPTRSTPNSRRSSRSSRSARPPRGSNHQGAVTPHSPPSHPGNMAATWWAQTGNA